jgi:hypothetical protein
MYRSVRSKKVIVWNALIECNKLNKDEFGNGYEKTKKTHIIIADNWNLYDVKADIIHKYQ